jgi:protein-tyrosine phosphatase
VVRICFVCLGNICRSPTAEGIFRHLVRERGIEDGLVIDSAGTGGWHVGEPPDRRATAEAARRGIDLFGSARQFVADDFDRFDYVIAMDEMNSSDLVRLAPDAAARGKVRLLRSFDPESPDGAGVPDPYYGGARGFEDVFAICEAACRGLIAHLEAEHGLRAS